MIVGRKPDRVLEMEPSWLPAWFSEMSEYERMAWVAGEDEWEQMAVTDCSHKTIIEIWDIE